ncbi:MAG TPA: sulfite exporter TauE/SafE family protein [Candidatus Limnocylindrales bacterium]|nr:sulfite exporter TauE/SafE family protein [Candidatus Limnocylindrales bacterium]
MIRHPLVVTAALGAAAGASGGMMGVGGGTLLVPLLVYVMHEPQHDAQAVSLAFIVGTAAVAVIPYLASEHLDWRLAGVLAAGALPGVVWGARVSRRISALWLRRAFGVALLATALRLLIAPPAVAGAPVPWGWPAQAGLGLTVGFLAGLLGIGGGTILVPALVLAQRIPQHVAQGVSLLLIIPVGIAGAAAHARSGSLPVRLLPGLLVGGALGGLAGGLLAQRIAGPSLSRIFALFLLVVSFQMILGRPRAREGAPTPILGGSP